jgi:hypothetical protein
MGDLDHLLLVEYHQTLEAHYQNLLRPEQVFVLVPVLPEQEVVYKSVAVALQLLVKV